MIDRPYDYLKCTYSHLDYDSLQVLEGWSVKALMNRFDKRSLQMQIDTHKLFLLTSYHARPQTGEFSSPKAALLSSKSTSRCSACRLRSHHSRGWHPSAQGKSLLVHLPTPSSVA